MAKANGPVGVRAGRDSAIVDVVHRRQAHRLAKIAFVVTLCTVAPTVAVVLLAFTDALNAVMAGLLVGVAAAVVAGVVALVWPLLRLVWWWTGELLALVGLLAAYVWLTTWLPGLAALGVLAGVAGVVLLVPASRRTVLAWVWCAISRHRLRTCFATFIRVNRRGSIPLILLAWPTRAGERVWVCLRPGLAIEDLTTEGGLARLAVGCWAHEVRITRAFSRFAPLLRIDITRRNPLAGDVASPLTAMLPDPPEADAETVDVGGVAGFYDGDQAAIAGLALDLADVAEPGTWPGHTAVQSPRPAGNRAASPTRRPSPTPATKPAPTPAAALPAHRLTSDPATSEPVVVGRGGEDISDWL